MTLKDLTGQSSGIVLYRDNTYMAISWDNYGTDALPAIFCGTIIALPRADGIFDGAERHIVNDYHDEIDNAECVYALRDALEDIESGQPMQAAVYPLTDGTRVIAPILWA